MKLIDWMQRKGLQRNEVADLIGSRSWTVQNWISERTSPSLLFAIRIKNITKGRVSFEEMLSFDQLKKLKVYDGNKKSKNRKTKKN